MDMSDVLVIYMWNELMELCYKGNSEVAFSVSLSLIFPAAHFCWGSGFFFSFLVSCQNEVVSHSTGEWDILGKLGLRTYQPPEAAWQKDSQVQAVSPLGKQSAIRRPQSPVWGSGTECLTLDRGTGQGVPPSIVLAMERIQIVDKIEAKGYNRKAAGNG